MQYIENGWSKYKNQLRKSLQEYWKLKSELTSCVDGMSLRMKESFFQKFFNQKILDIYI